MIAAAALLFVSSAARADDPPAAEYPVQVINRPFQLYQGMTQISIGLNANLSTGTAFQPISPSISVGYGITHEFTLTGSFGLCLNGGDFGCGSAAGSASVIGTYSIGKLGPVATALFAGVAFPAFSPDVELGIPVGANFRFTPVPQVFSIVASPGFQFALTDRNTFQNDTFGVPFQFQYQASPHLELELGIAFNFGLDGAGTSLIAPVDVAATYAVTNLIDLGAQFTFGNLIGDGGSTDFRSLSLVFNYRI
jgi:hypothetical protein